MVILIQKTVWHIVGLTTLLLTGGWCIYFDQKRRKGVKELKIKPKNPIGIPKRPSSDDLQVFFLQEIEHGEKLLLAGDLEGCVEHFVNAIVVCSEPGKLLAILKQTLPRPIYLMVKLEIRLLSV